MIKKEVMFVDVEIKDVDYDVPYIFYETREHNTPNAEHYTGYPIFKHEQHRAEIRKFRDRGIERYFALSRDAEFLSELFANDERRRIKNKLLAEVMSVSPIHRKALRAAIVNVLCEKERIVLVAGAVGMTRCSLFVIAHLTQDQ